MSDLDRDNGFIDGYNKGYLEGLKAGVNAARQQLWQDLTDLGSTGDHYEVRMAALEALFTPAERQKKSS